MEKKDSENLRRKLIIGVIALGVVFLGIDEYFNPQIIPLKKQKVVSKTKKRSRQAIPTEKSQLSQLESEMTEDIATVPSQLGENQVLENIQRDPSGNSDSQLSELTEEELNYDLEYSPSSINTGDSAAEKTPIAQSQQRPLSSNADNTGLTSPTSNEESEQNSHPENTILREINIARLQRTEKGKLRKNVEKIESVIKNIVPEPIPSIAPKNNPEVKNESLKNLPDYDRIGKGLVYNCINKHWACLDKVEFFKCKNLQNEAKEIKGPPPCAIFEVYQSSDECHLVQTQKINEKAPISLCQIQDEIKNE